MIFIYHKSDEGQNISLLFECQQSWEVYKHSFRSNGYITSQIGQTAPKWQNFCSARQTTKLINMALSYLNQSVSFLTKLIFHTVGPADWWPIAHPLFNNHNARPGVGILFQDEPYVTFSPADGRHMHSIWSVWGVCVMMCGDSGTERQGGKEIVRFMFLSHIWIKRVMK